MVFHDKVLRLLVALYPSWEGTGDLAAGTSVSWVNIAKCAAVLILALLVLRPAGNEPAKACGTSESRAIRLYVNGSFLALLLYVFGWFVPEMSRICYYLTVTQIFLIPMLLHRIPENESMGILRSRRNQKSAGDTDDSIGAASLMDIASSRGTTSSTDREASRESGKTCTMRRLLTGIVILAAVLYFALFLKTAYRDTIKILPYKSFLFHELNQTPSGSIE